MRVAVVDIQSAITNSTRGAVLAKRYRDEVEKVRSELQMKELKLKSLSERFERERASLDALSRLDREEYLLSLERSIKRGYEDSAERLGKKNEILGDELVEELRIIVREIGKREGFAMIVEKTADFLLYVDDVIDLTEQVICEVDKISEEGE